MSGQAEPCRTCPRAPTLPTQRKQPLPLLRHKKSDALAPTQDCSQTSQAQPAADCNRATVSKRLCSSGTPFPVWNRPCTGNAGHRRYSLAGQLEADLAVWLAHYRNRQNNSSSRMAARPSMPSFDGTRHRTLGFRLRTRQTVRNMNIFAPYGTMVNKYHIKTGNKMDANRPLSPLETECAGK